MVSPSSSTVNYIRQKVRKLTSCPSESSLSTNTIDQTINNFYTNDFAYGIKVDQMREVYTFYTQPYIDRYPLDVNYTQGVRSPLYIDGVQGAFYKDRQQFYNVWPKFPTYFQPATGDGSTQSFSFTIPAPFLSNTVTLGTISDVGTAISISDDGAGNLYYRFPNPRVYVPVQNSNPAIPGMHNGNTGNPGIQNSIYIGSVNYETGQFAFNLALANVIPGDGEVFTLWVSLYQPGKPYALLFWNNEFVIRPVPKIIHRIEIEVYLTPVQFMLTTDVPILNQWAKYIAYGAAIDILFDRQDFDAVKILQPMLEKQEQLVLERQATEEIGIPNYTLFNSSQPYPYFGGWNLGGY